MIKSAHGINLKSWEDILLKFHPGINMLVGHTRAGKTNFYRGIRLINENKPGNANYVSKWAREINKKGEIKITGKFSFTLELDNGVIERSRGPGGAKDNLYIVSGTDLKAVGKGVPDEVTTLLDMNEVNFGSQHGAPFLLRPDGNGGAEASRFLNGLIDFTEADNAIAACNDLKTAANTQKNRLKANLKELKEKAAKFEYLEELQELVEDAKDLEIDINSIVTVLDNVTRAKNSLSELLARKSKLPNTEKIGTLLAEITKMQQEIVVIGERRKHVETLTTKFKKCLETKEATQHIDKIGKLINEAQSLDRGAVALGARTGAVTALVIKLKKAQGIKAQQPDWAYILPMLESAEELQTGIKARGIKIANVTALVDKLKKGQETKALQPDWVEIMALVEDAEELQAEICAMQAKTTAVSVLTKKLGILGEKKVKLMAQHQEMEKELGEICPACKGTGRALK